MNSMLEVKKYIGESSLASSSDRGKGEEEDLIGDEEVGKLGNTR